MTSTCLLCTFHRRKHPELSADVLAFPVFSVGRHGLEAGRPRYFVKEGCRHARVLDDGDWESLAEIEQAWESIVKAQRK